MKPAPLAVAFLIIGFPAGLLLWQHGGAATTSVVAEAHVHGETCDCGHEHPAPTSTATSPAIPSLAAKGRLNVPAMVAQLQARLAAGETVPDLHSTLIELVSQDARGAIDVAIAAARNLTETHDLAAMTSEIWAASDADSAWAWTRQNASTIQQSGRDSLYAAVLRGAASMNPAAVPTLVESHLAAPPSGFAPADADKLTRDALVALVNSGELTLARTTLTRWQQHPPSRLVAPAALANLAGTLQEN